MASFHMHKSISTVSVNHQCWNQDVYYLLSTLCHACQGLSFLHSEGSLHTPCHPCIVKCASCTRLEFIPQCASAESYSVTDRVVEAAIEAVETKRSQNGTTLTLKRLAKFLSNENEAICNSEFELMHFGWPLPANMLKGNPKRKRTNLDD